MTEFLPQDTGDSSLWVESAIEDSIDNQLHETLQTSVLVVGGGYMWTKGVTTTEEGPKFERFKRIASSVGWKWEPVKKAKTRKPRAKKAKKAE